MPQQRRKQQTKTLWFAIISVIGTIAVAWIKYNSNAPEARREHASPRVSVARPLPKTSKPLPVDSQPAQTGAAAIQPPPIPATEVGRLVGHLTNRAGTPIGGMAVAIRNGPETSTDSQGGAFVLSEVPAGDQFIVIKPPGGRGAVTQHIRIEPRQTTEIKIVYDASGSHLGLLSITAPVTHAILDVRRDRVAFGFEHRATIYGRCDGLAEMLGTFDIWVLIKSETDPRFWVQHPPAVVDPTTKTWHANVIIGSLEIPPHNNEQWDIIAVAADATSDIDNILNTPRLTELPPHISSNVATAIIRIRP